MSSDGGPRGIDWAIRSLTTTATKSEMGLFGCGGVWLSGGILVSNGLEGFYQALFTPLFIVIAFVCFGIPTYRSIRRNFSSPLSPDLIPVDTTQGESSSSVPVQLTDCSGTGLPSPSTPTPRRRKKPINKP